MATTTKLAPIQNVAGTTPTDRIVKTAREVEAAVADHGYRLTLIYGSTTWDDHNNLRCADLMTSSARKVNRDGTSRPLSLAEQRELGDWIADYVWANAERLGLNWAIWNHRIRRYQNTNRGYGWGAYSGPNPHTDHVHIEVAAGAYRAPSGPKKVHAEGSSAKPWTGVMWATKAVKAYSSSGKPVRTLPKGTRIRGTVDRDKFNDGRYLRVGQLWVPIDALTHDSPKPKAK